MININSEHKNLYVNAYKLKPDFQYEMQFDDFKLVNNDFVKDSFELTESICKEESIVFGSCNASQLKITLANVANVSHGKTFTLVQKVNNNYTMPLGTFTVYSATKQEDKRYTDIIAYDNMQKFNTDVLDWYNGLTFPLTLKQFRDSLCSYLGVTQKSVNLINDGIIVEKTISANTLNGLNVLKSICEINGVFGHMDRYGSLTYISLNPTSVDTIAKENIREIKYEQYTDNTITKVQIRQDDGDVGAYSGTGTNCYYITGNFLAYGKPASDLQTIADNVATKILGLTYRTYIGEMTGRPDIEVGDYITYNVTSTYLFKRVLKGFQAIIDSIEAKGTEKLSEDTSLNIQIIQLKGQSNVLKRTVEEMTNTITSLETDVNDAVTTVSQMENTVQQTSQSLLVEITARKESITSIIGNNYCDEEPIDDEDVCDDDEDTLVTNLLKDTSAKLLLLSDLFNIELLDNVNKLQSSISLTAASLTTKINNDTAGLNSTIEQTANSLTSTINNLKTNTSTQIEQLDNAIGLKVDANGIISAINLSPEQIKLSALKIALEGLVTANNKFMILTDGSMSCLNASLQNAVFSGGIYYLFSGTQFPIFEVPLQGQLQLANSATHTKVMGSFETAYSAILRNVTIDGYTPLTLGNYTAYCAPLSHAHGTLYANSAIGNVSAYFSSSSNFVSTSAGSLGTSSNPWDGAYLRTAPTVTSDERAKNSILDLDDRYEELLLNLPPKSYKLNSGTSDRRHTGFIAQDIERLLDELGIDTNDFAALIKAPVYAVYNDEWEPDTTSKIIDYDYSLRYEELMSPMLGLIQKQSNENKELRKEVENMKKDIEMLKSLMKAGDE